MPWFLTLTVIAVLGTFAWGAILAAPWLPLPRREVERLLALACPRPGDLVCDLGCGDGRVLTQAARRFGARGVGFEVALLPYLVGWCRIATSGRWRTVRIRYGNFFQHPLGRYDIVTAFLTPRAMAKLGPKMAAELTPGARVISYAFPIPGWEPTAVSKPDAASLAIYRYEVGRCSGADGLAREPRKTEINRAQKTWL